MTIADADRLYFRQLLSGVDFAVGDPLATGMVNYVYVVGDRITHEAVLVDPAYDPAGLIEIVGDDGYTITGAIVTHYHGDHAGGVLGPTLATEARQFAQQGDGVGIIVTRTRFHHSRCDE